MPTVPSLLRHPLQWLRDTAQNVQQRVAPQGPGVPAIASPYRDMEKARQSVSLEAFLNQIPNFEEDQEPMPRLQAKYAHSSTWVYIAVKRIADAGAQVPLVVLDRNKEGQPDQIVRSHDRGLLALLAKPNPWQSGFDFLENYYTSTELTGNAFIALDAIDSFGRPHEMRVLNPARVTIIPDPKNYVKGYLYNVNGTYLPFPAKDIIHIKYAHSDNDYWGMSPLTAARFSIDVDRASLEWNRTFLLRGGWPAGAIEGENDIDDKGLRRLQRELKTSLMRGKDAAGLILLLTGGLKYKKLALTPKEMDWLDARRLSRDEILAIYGVPFAVAGLFSTEQTTARSAGVTQQVKNFYIFTMYPKLQKLISGLNLGLAPLFGERFELAPDLKGIPALRDDVEQDLIRAQTYRTLTGGGWSPNAALAELYPHVPRFPWGDAWWVNQAMVPVTGPKNDYAALPAPANQTPENGNGNGTKPPAKALDLLRQWLEAGGRL